MRAPPVGGNERGSIVILGFAAALIVVMVGVLVVDLWRGFAARQALAAQADAAAAAGANAVDHERYRHDGVIVLDPDRAAASAFEILADQPSGAPVIRRHSIEVSPERVVIIVHGEVPLTVLGLLGGRRSFEVSVLAEAVPRRGG